MFRRRELKSSPSRLTSASRSHTHGAKLTQCKSVGSELHAAHPLQPLRCHLRVRGTGRQQHKDADHASTARGGVRSGELPRVLLPSHRKEQHMTLIIAHRDGYMIADRGEQAGPHKIPSDINKIFRTPCNNWLMALAGDCAISQRIQRKLNTESDTIEQVCDMLWDMKKENLTLLGLSRDGDIVEIDSNGYVCTISKSESYYAGGLTGTEAVAFLKGVEATGHKVTQQHCIAALFYSHALCPVIDQSYTIMTHSTGGEE